jgi:hypothetical protein
MDGFYHTSDTGKPLPWLDTDNFTDARLVASQDRFRMRLAEGECPRSDRWRYVGSFDSQDE